MDQELSPKLQGKLAAKFGKLSMLLEKRGEREAHVMVTKERHQVNAEITLQFYDHQLVGFGSNGELFTAMSIALEKLEKQAVNQRGKWREKARRHDGLGHAAALAEENAKEEAPAAAKVAEPTPTARVFRVNHLNRRKPMTLEEAVIKMENGREYMVYRDADRECLSVLVRRRDGNFDLIESA
jgi:putative sigma-54 modulation protein